MVEAKGLRLFLEALERLDRPDVLGVFLGRGPLQEEVVRSSRARYVGGIPHARVPMYMRAADLLVLPSFSEGMPTVLVEAGAARLPVIASSVGGIGELLAEDRGVTIRAGSLEELVAALESALARPDEMQGRARRLRGYVETSYDVEVNARSTLRLYESLR
jgi:teichuronic acid biosynthesis glycosyltransferase TuaC